MSDKHTPGPWHVGMKPGPMVYGPLGEQVADCRSVSLEGNESGHNAKLIVRACNSHYELLEACQHALAVCEAEAVLRGENDTDEYQGGAAGPVVDMLLKAIQNATK